MALTKRIRGRQLQAIRERHKRKNPLCGECQKQGIVREWDELDHSLSLYHGGQESDDNRVGLCREHHKAKTMAEFNLIAKRTTGADGWPV